MNKVSKPGNIIEARNLPDNEKIYLKKDWFGWRVVEPLYDPETNEFILRNFFSKKGFLTLLIVIVIISVGYLAFNEQITSYQYVMENPCKVCKETVLEQREINPNNSITLGGDTDNQNG